MLLVDSEIYKINNSLKYCTKKNKNNSLKYFFTNSLLGSEIYFYKINFIDILKN